MDCRFYVGQKIICVDTAPGATPGAPRFSGKMHGLREGAVYTVRAVVKAPPVWVDEYPDHAGMVRVYLNEIHRPFRFDLGIEVGYIHTRFRPATDISSLEAPLRTTKTPVGKKEPA